MPDPAVNVASLYAAFRDDIVKGDRTVPDFDHAVQLTRLVKDVTRAAETGIPSQADGWRA